MKVQSKIISMLLTLAMIFLLVPAAAAENDDTNTDPIAVTGVSLVPSSLTLYMGGNESETLTATIEPEEADQTVIWESSDPDVADVDDSGNVTAHSQGNATITITSTYDSSKSATCQVNVIPTAQWVADSINSIADPVKGATQMALPSVPDGFTRSIASSSNESVIDIKGNITPPTVNTIVTLTLRIAREYDDTEANTIGLNVTVPAKEVEVIKKVTQVTISSSNTTVRMGKTLQMDATVKPSDAADKSLTWSVTNGTGRAKINSTTGLLTPEKVGKVTVKATANDGSGKSDTQEVTIISASTILVDYIVVKGDADKTSVAKGKTLKMIASVYPNDASNKSVTWSVDEDTGEAKISSTGVLTGLKEGNVTVIAKAKDGSGVEGKRIIKITRNEEDDNLVDKAGGTVKEGDVIVSVPRDAVDREIEIDIGRISSRGLTIPEGYKLVSDVYYISKNHSRDFKKNVTITIPFNKKGLDQKKDKLALYIWDEDYDEWIELSSIRVNWSDGTVRGAIDYLGKFAVLAEFEEELPVIPAPKPETVVLKDINTHWAKSSINKLVALGAIKGYPDNTFRPDQTITRAEFAAVLVKAFDLPVNTQKIFNDTRGHWAQIQIASAYKAGIIAGYDANTFGPDDPITREQMAVMTVKAAKLGTSSTTLKFKDSNAVSSWAKASVATAVNKGLLTGYPDNTFKPSNNATRAEAVVVTVLALK